MGFKPALTKPISDRNGYYVFWNDPIEEGQKRAVPRRAGVYEGVCADSERCGELGAALEGSPPRGPFDLRDPKHFPPMRAPAAASE